MEKNSNEVIKYRNKLAYMIIAFHQGLSYISQLAIQYFFKDELKIEPAKLAQINSIIHLPWAIKPILGLITDFVPIFGYRRKFYILLCGIINMIAWLFMTIYVDTSSMATTMILLVNLTLSFCSVLGEAIVVELSKIEKMDKDSKAKDYVSMFFLSRTVGELLSSYFKGLFVDIMPLRKIFLISCFIPFLLIFAGIILIEFPEQISNQEIQTIDPENQIKNKESKFTEFFNFMTEKYVLIPLSFIIIFKATPNYHDPFFYFLTNELKLSASDLGEISFCSTVAVLVAILIYKSYLKNCNFKFMIILGTIISFFISLSCYLLVLRVNTHYGISDFWLLLFTNSFLSMVGEFVLLPILSLACVLCPKKLEGTVYSVFMSTLNLGGIISQLNGSFLTNMLNISTSNYTNLHVLILMSKIFSLLPLPILLFIEDKYFNPEKKESDEANIKQINEEETENLNIKKSKT